MLMRVKISTLVELWKAMEKDWKILLRFGGLGCAMALSGSLASPSSCDATEPSVTIHQKLKMAKYDIDQIYAKHRAAQNIPGLIYGVVVDGELCLWDSQGTTSVNAPALPNRSSRFRIASMSKSFTAMAIVQLRDRGMLVLDDPVEKYVPEVADICSLTTDSPNLTIRHLLTMQSGLPQDDPWGDRLLDISDKDLRNLLTSRLHRANPTATRYEYSNLSYGILGLVITNITKLPYQQYITENILHPLGMTNTHYEYDDVRPTSDLVPGYRFQDGLWMREPMLHDGSLGAMGGLITSLDDFVKYMSYLQSAWPPKSSPDCLNSPVTASTLREMQSPACPIETMIVSTESNNPVSVARSKFYGYGLEWNMDNRGVRVLRHAGGLPGFSCEFRLLPDYGIGIVSFSNRTYASMTSANSKVMDHLVDNNIITRRDTSGVMDNYLAVRGRELFDAITKYQWGCSPREGGGASIFAINFFEDIPQRLRLQESSKIINSLGGNAMVTMSPLEPMNNLRGVFYLQGWAGEKARVFYTLTPENPPRIQEVKLELIRSTTANGGYEVT